MAPGRYAGAMTSSDTLLSAVPSAAPNTAFLHALPSELEAMAIPDKAAGMAKYMKSSMPFMGVPSPSVRKTVRSLAKVHPFSSVVELHSTVTELWNTAQFREERYSAIMLTDSALGRGEMGLLPFYAVVIGSGQWWDYVDSVAPRLSELLLKEPEDMEALLRQWSVDENFWFRRAAIIAQLPAKSATNVPLLQELIEPNLGDKEFFIRKAIGWALRQYARTDPDWVRDYVSMNEQRLSGLSYREALKHL